MLSPSRIETRMKRALARTLFSSVLPQLLSRPYRVGDLTLDPQVEWLLRMSEWMGEPKTHEQSVQDARRTFVHQLQVVDLPFPPGVDIEDRQVFSHGSSIPIRIYRPDAVEGDAPTLLYFHGGGFVVGNLESHDGVCRWLAKEAKIVLIAVDYRLAPEHPFPAAIDDGLAVYQWVEERRTELNIGALGVGGDSAGACLSAVLCQQIRALGWRSPALQLLLYPVTHVDSQLPSRQLFEKAVLLQKETIDWFTLHYLPHRDQRSDPRASPLLAERFDHLAPALVITAGFDPLRDEGAMYAAKLREAGGFVEEYCATSLPHGFWSMGGVSKEARRWIFRIARRVGLLLRS